VVELVAECVQGLLGADMQHDHRDPRRACELDRAGGGSSALSGAVQRDVDPLYALGLMGIWGHDHDQVSKPT
jgi:hypothetical protein